MNQSSSHVAFFSLSAYFHLGPLRYLLFFALFILYMLMFLANAFFMAIICLNKSLHEPMYIFFCSLFGNSMFGSSIIFPFLLHQILQEVHIVPSGFCYFQAFSIHTYGLTELLTLTAMSYDRYLAICAPLQYNTRMNRNKLVVLVLFPWLYSCLSCVYMIMLTWSLQLCGNVIHKVYCDNFPIVKLACSDTTEQNVSGLVLSMVNIFFPVSLILFTYIRILRVCFSGNKQTRYKATSTCMPHITCLVNFGIGAAFEIIQSRFNMSRVPDVARVFLSLYFWLVQPLLDAFIYGLNNSKIRVLCKSLFVSKLETDFGS